MQYSNLDLDIVKKHLNLDPEFAEDDRLIMQYVDIALESVENHINRPLEDLINEEGELPKTIIGCVLLMVGNLYQNREMVSYTSCVEVPYTYRYLIDQNYHYC